jgi:hypothetical protein
MAGPAGGEASADIPEIFVQNASGDGMQRHRKTERSGEDNDGRPRTADSGSFDERNLYDEDLEDANHHSDIFNQNPDGMKRSEYGNLGNHLRQCGIQHADKDKTKRFWPSTVLPRILTRDGIIEELIDLRARFPIYLRRTPEQLADTIRRHHQKIFAILILIGQGHYIEKVIDESLQDKHLPLRVRGSSLHGVVGNTLQPIQCFSEPGWEWFHRDLFCDFQYALNPCILDLDKDGRSPKHMKLPLKAVLPFTRKVDRHQGGYGAVSEIQVHSDCHKFHGLLRSVRY